jgi:hypothetical protein
MNRYEPDPDVWSSDGPVSEVSVSLDRRVHEYDPALGSHMHVSVSKSQSMFVNPSAASADQVVETKAKMTTARFKIIFAIRGRRMVGITQG